MASWVRDRLSLGSSRNSNVVNSREVSSQIDVSNWKIPKQKIEIIYQVGKFNFNTALLIKDYEAISSIGSPMGSPTYSTMQPLSFSSINVISTPFEINKDYLRQNFNSIENKVKREWFLSHFDLKAQAFMRTEWYSFTERHQVNVPFFNWWAMFALDNNLPDPFQVNEINTNINFAKKWTLLNGQIITSFTPPLQEIILNTPEGNIPSVPFKIGRNNPETSQVVLNDIKKVYHQNNYTNQVLHTMSQHVNMVSTQVEPIVKKQEVYSLTEKLESLDINDTKKDKPNFLDDIAKPLFKIRRSNILELPDTSTPLISKIEEKLKEIEASTFSSVKNTANILEKDLSQFDDEFQNINKIYKKEIPYYSKQTPPDLHLESAKTIITENFAGDSIYEWNMDGRSDHEIFITLQRMLIAYTAYSTKRATDLQAFDLLTSGFTGMLKHWWENYIQEEERNKIRIHTNSQGQLDNIQNINLYNSY